MGKPSARETMKIPAPCHGEPEKLTLRVDWIVPSDLCNIDPTVDKILRLLNPFRSRNDLEKVDLAMHEALVNAIVHGNHNCSSKAVRVTVALRQDDSLLLIVKDQGVG